MIKFRIVCIIILPLLLSSCNTGNAELIEKEKVTEVKACCTNDSTAMSKEQSTTSEITCPKCGHKKTEEMPTEMCVIKYTCENCKTDLNPKAGDCCVYCSYGTHKCPSMQDN
jgi:hypothetical protein